MFAPRVPSSIPRPPRKAFTLIELLVVISIMALLTAMFVVVMARTTENARVAGTRTLIRLLDSALQDRIEGFRSANLRTVARRQSQLSGMSPELAEALYRVFMFRGSFPQRLKDLYGFDFQASDSPNSAVNQDNAALLGVLLKKVKDWQDQQVPKQPMKPLTQLEIEVSSAELLYLFLTEGESFGVPALNLDGIDARYIADTDNDGLREFVDGWGNPLRFYNAPTSLLRPAGTNQPILVADYATARILIRSLAPLPVNSMTGVPIDVQPTNYQHPLNSDPFDPLGEIQASLPITGFAAGTLNVGRCERELRTLNTFSTPLIVSAGPDERLGLFEPNLYTLSKGVNPTSSSAQTPAVANDRNRLGAVLAVEDLYDNLTNQQRGGL